jgi:hypothetical protein
MSQGYNNLDFNNIYRNWLQGQIETANARGLMGGQTPGQIIDQDLVRPINRIINQAKSDMRNPNRGVPVGNQGLVGRGPTSISTPKQLPAVTAGSNIVNPNARIPKVQPRVNTPNVINMYPSNDIKLLTYDPTKTIVDTSLGKQTMFKLPNGTYTSNPDLVNIAKQQMAKAAKLAKVNKANALMMFPELMNLWFGTTDGIKGPGRTVLEQTPWGNFIYGNKGTLTPEMIAGMQSTKAFLNKSDNNKPSGGNNNTGTPANMGNKVARGAGSRPTAQAQALALAQQLGGNPPITNQQGADVQRANMDAINDYVSKLQEINQPYLDALKGYLDNYDNLYNQNQLASRRLRDISAITGDPIWYQSSKDYNPMLAEANKVELQKKVQEAQAGDLNAINEIMGNLAMAQEMGLPPEAAFANKNLLTAMTMRDRNLTNREIAQLNNAAKLQIALQNAQNRLAVQKLRNQGGMTNALIYAGQYGQPAPGLSQQGTAGNVASMDAMLQSAHNKNNR